MPLGFGAIAEFAIADSSLNNAAAQGAVVGSSISGGYFSKRRWHELLGELAQEAHERAAKLGQKKAREALARAAKEAEAARVIAAERAQEADLAKLARLMEAATDARKMRDVIAQANAAVEHAKFMRAELERLTFEEDEEEALALLLAA